MTTARCYACHSLRPIYEFPYRRKDGAITPSSRMKRYLGVLLQRPGASTFDRRGTGGAIYRYRCIHPRAGRCPEVSVGYDEVGVRVAQEEVLGVEREEVGVERVERRELERRDEDEVGRGEIEIEIAVEARDEEQEFRRQKEEALKELRQCVDAAETNV